MFTNPELWQQQSAGHPHTYAGRANTMKKAWEIARELFIGARPIVRSAEDQTWEENLDVSLFYDQNLALDWGSNVPGSGAPEQIMTAAVQALENRGYRVSKEGYGYLNEGLKAFEQKDYVRLHRCSALLRRADNIAIRLTSGSERR